MSNKYRQLVPLSEIPAEIRSVLEAVEKQAAILAENKAEEIEAAAAKVEEPSSTEHAEAGTYRKGHVTLYGLGITIENAKGSTRSGKDKDGKVWSVTMPAHYGYVKGTTGKDGDHVDVYIGDSPESDKVWVVDQLDADNGDFDEHKCLLAFPSKDTAQKTYLDGFSDGKGKKRLGDITEMTVDEFKEWAQSGKTKNPVSDEVDESVDLGFRFSEELGVLAKRVDGPATDERLVTLHSVDPAHYAVSVYVFENDGWRLLVYQSDVHWKTLPGAVDTLVQSSVRQVAESAISRKVAGENRSVQLDLTESLRIAFTPSRRLGEAYDVTVSKRAKSGWNVDQHVRSLPAAALGQYVSDMRLRYKTGSAKDIAENTEDDDTFELMLSLVVEPTCPRCAANLAVPNAVHRFKLSALDDAMRTGHYDNVDRFIDDKTGVIDTSEDVEDACAACRHVLKKAPESGTPYSRKIQVNTRESVSASNSHVQVTLNFLGESQWVNCVQSVAGGNTIRLCSAGNRKQALTEFKNLCKRYDLDWSTALS